MDRSYALHIIGDIRDYQKKLAEVPGITDKQAAAASLKWAERMRRAQDDAAKAAAGSAGKASKAWEKLGETAGGVGGSAKKLRGLLSSIAPGADVAAGAIDDVGDGLEVLSGIGSKLLGPWGLLVAAVVAGGVAYKALSMELANAEKVQARQRATVEALGPFYDQAADATRKLKIATGEMSEATAKDLEVRDRWNASAATTIAKLQEQRDILADDITPGIVDTSLAFFGVKESYDDLAHSMAQSAGWLNPFAMLWDQSAQATERSRAAWEAAGGQIEKVGRVASDAADKEIRATKITAGHSAALEIEARAFDQLQESLAASADRWKRYSAAVVEAQGIGAKWAEQTLDETERVYAARDADLTKIGELATAALMAAKSDEERAAAVQVRDAAAKQVQIGAVVQVAEIRAKAAEEGRADAEEAAAARADAAAQEVQEARDVAAAKAQIANDYLGSLQTATDTYLQWNARAQEAIQAKIDAGEGQLTEAQLAQLEKRRKAQKAGAIAAFVIARAASVSAAVVNALQAGSNALAQVPIPFNVPASIAATAAGLVRAGAIAASPPPKFAVGSSTGVRGTNEVPIVAHEGELLVTSSAAKRPGVREQVGRFNAGMGGGAPPLIIADRYQGRIWPASLREAGKLGYLTTASGRRGARFGQFIPAGG